MTMYTPVVFTDDPAVQALAHAHHWAVVERHPDNPSVLRIPGVSTLCTMPQPTMSIANGSLDAASTPTWNYVLNWLARFVHKPLPIVAANDYATELALWAAANRNWPIGALIHGDLPTLNTQSISLFTAANGFFIPDTDLAVGFTSTWVAPVEQFELAPLVDVPPSPHHEPTRRAEGVTRVLLVAYYAGPSPTVGVHRVNYWFEQIATLSDHAVTVDLAMATDWPDAPPGVRRIKDFGVATLAAERSPLAPWANELLENSAQSAYPIQHTPGGLWHLALERYFESTEDEYDVVICSGNPYGYFDFAHYAKRRWFARTILDYRDPFVGNPRLIWKPEAKQAAQQLEAGWNMNADLVLAVNDVAASVAEPGTAETRIEVIPNGYDERVAAPGRAPREADAPVRFGHAGQLYRITPPDTLLQALRGRRGEFHQFGAHLEDDKGALVVNHGRVSRSEVLTGLAELDCGVTFAGETGIETPTKLFDYIAVGLDVLILYKGDPEASAMWTMLEGTAGIHWVADDPATIATWLETYQPTRHTDPARGERFSRATSTRKLIDLVLELGDHSYFPPRNL